MENTTLGCCESQQAQKDVESSNGGVDGLFTEEPLFLPLFIMMSSGLLFRIRFLVTIFALIKCLKTLKALVNMVVILTE